jgi:hypothetical protein
MAPESDFIGVSLDSTANEEMTEASRNVDEDVIEDLTTAELTESEPNVTSVLAYPNPATTMLNVQVDEAGEGVVRLTLYDFFGKAVLTNSIDSIADRLNIPLDISNLPRGRYILQVITPDGSRRAHQIMME